MQKTGKYYWLSVVCYTTLTLGFIPILLFTGWISRSLWGIAGGMIICGFSNGIGGTSSLIALSKQKERLFRFFPPPDWPPNSERRPLS